MIMKSFIASSVLVIILSVLNLSVAVPHVLHKNESLSLASNDTEVDASGGTKSTQSRSSVGPEDNPELELGPISTNPQDVPLLQSPVMISIFVLVPIVLLIVVAICTIRYFSSRAGSTRASSMVFKAGSEPPRTPDMNNHAIRQGPEDAGIDLTPITTQCAFSDSKNPYGNPTTEPI